MIVGTLDLGTTMSDLARPHEFPWVTGILVVTHSLAWIFGHQLSIHEPRLAMIPDATLRQGEFWRLLSGFLMIPSQNGFLTVYVVLSLLTLGSAREMRFGRMRLLGLYFGAGVASHFLWSASALIWDWHWPLSTAPAAFALAVDRLIWGAKTPVLKTDFFSLPGWIISLALIVGGIRLTQNSVVEYSALAFAGLFSITYWQFRLPDHRTQLPNPSVVPSMATTTGWENPSRELGDDDEFRAKVDDLLRKISETGYGSLTEAEIQLLMEASQRYRDHRNPEEPRP